MFGVRVHGTAHGEGDGQAVPCRLQLEVTTGKGDAVPCRDTSFLLETSLRNPCVPEVSEST